jgi:hypothetical protein
MSLAGVALDYPGSGQGERRVAFLGRTGFQARSDYKFFILHSKIKIYNQLAAEYPREL